MIQRFVFLSLIGLATLDCEEAHAEFLPRFLGHCRQPATCFERCEVCSPTKVTVWECAPASQVYCVENYEVVPVQPSSACCNSYSSAIEMHSVASGCGSYFESGSTGGNVVETKTYSIVNPVDETKEDIRRIKSKLDEIQPGKSPTLNELQNELKEIKDLLKSKSTNVSPETRKMLEYRIQLVANVIDKEPRVWTSASGLQSAVATLVSVNETTITLKRKDGKICKVHWNVLSENDQAFVGQIRLRIAATLASM